jgi:hypothetical protein
MIRYPAKIKKVGFSDPPGWRAQPEVRCKTELESAQHDTPDQALKVWVLIAPIGDCNHIREFLRRVETHVLIAPIGDCN